MTSKDENPGKRGRKVRIDLRKNRGKPARDKAEWTRKVRAGDESAEDAETIESVRHKGELSRKRTVIVHDEPQVEQAARTGIVVTVRGLVTEVDDGETVWACIVRRLLRTRLIEARAPITVGDEVKFLPVVSGQSHGIQISEDRPLPEGVIDDVAPRRTTLLRQYERKVQVIAANVDQAVITVAVDEPTLRPHLVDRYLVAVHKGGMRPIICINKADLDANGAAAVVADRYRGLGYQSLMTCTHNGLGVGELRALLVGKTSAFVGPSGVGKSSLINAIEPGMSLKVGTLTDLKRGKHTTTTARLLQWKFGGYVVDTPGLRQFDPADVAREELEAYFIEFRDRVAGCKFPDCSHTHESDCAIRAAVDAGQITIERYESYCKMYEECAARPEYE